MPGLGQQHRRQRRSTVLEAVSGTRRIYDPRRWHRRSSDSSSSTNDSYTGQPPAGWVLVWAGRFKRWRRRWFVAHPPGLLLHYKDSDQIGRPGCISLLGASVVPTVGKERQFKIVKGSMVYYLRTISRDFRQGWLDAIHESMRIYKKSVQKAAIGATPGRSLLPQQSVPEHVKEEWVAQERELNRKLAERLQDLEPSRQKFLQQLQALQHSLSVISGALGFSDQLETEMSIESKKQLNEGFNSGNAEKSNVMALPRQMSASGDDSCLRSSYSDLTCCRSTQNGQRAPVPTFTLPESVLRTQRSIFKWKGDNESKQGKKRSSKPSLLPPENPPTSRRRSFSFSLEDSLSKPEYMFLRGNSMTVECFKWKRKGSRVQGKGHSSDSEVATGSCKQALLPEKIGNSDEIRGSVYKDMDSFRNGDGDRVPLYKEHSVAVPDSSSVGKSSVRKSGFMVPRVRNKEDASGLIIPSFPGESFRKNYFQEGSGSSTSSALQIEMSESRVPVTAASFCSLNPENKFSGEILNRAVLTGSSGEKHVQGIQGPLHAAWNRMQEAFAEALKEEIHRFIELEAENVVLQESLAMLPQLQKDRTELLHLRERLQADGLYDYGKNKIVRNSTRDGDAESEEECDDSEDDVSLVHTDVTNEEYFEALEVLNQHDFMAKATSAEDQEGLYEREDSAQEPPEEGDIAVDTEILSEAEGDELEQPRTRLPAPRPLSRGFSLWTVLKNAIGKDLNHITMPATINEPLSVLQKCAEELQYRDLLDKGAKEESSVLRLLWVSAFACASYNGSIHRDAKPFNPLLGETYEWQAPDGKFWFLAEQVSHHPPVMAFHSESTQGDYRVYGEIEIKNKFWGKSVEVLPTGVCHLRFNKYGDHFSWNKVTTCAHNVVVGKLWIDNYGELVINNHASGDTSRVRFHKASSRDQCRIAGKVYNAQGTQVFTIHGNYMDKIFATPEPSSVEASQGGEICLWTCPEQVEDYRQQYCFTKFSIGLNELPPKLAEVLPPTDSRLRPDQRALEDGDLEKATPEKLRLEEKQRAARKLRKELGQEWQPMWFELRVPGTTQVRTGIDGEEPSWVYRGSYWDAREKQAWQGCSDIM